MNEFIKIKLEEPIRFKISDEDMDKLMRSFCIPINSYEWTGRSSNRLSEMGYETFGELASIHPMRLLEQKDLGRKTLREIDNALDRVIPGRKNFRSFGFINFLNDLGINKENIKEKIDEYLSKKEKNEDKD